MSKNRISSVDLSWIISEQLSDLRSLYTRISMAVVPDEKDGWRVIVDQRGRRYLTAADDQRLSDVQKKLRLMYDLTPES